MGKVVIVIGVSCGIGVVIVKLLGSSDYKVCVNYFLDKNVVDSVCVLIVDNGGVVFVYKVDVLDEM